MPKVLVFGASCLDYIAEVTHFPSPAEKLRTQSLTICGGGNASNTATCLSRLDIPVKLICKIGGDVNGDTIIEEFHREKNIDTDSILRQSSMKMSPMTYVIVDRQTNTRTCLYTAENELVLVDDIRADWLDGIDFIHFDSRSTEAAVHLARLAKDRSIPCSLDLERSRPFLDQLITQMDFIITTENYSRHVCQDVHLHQTALRFFPTSRFVIITRGKHGSVLFEPLHDQNSLASIPTAMDGSVVTQKTLCIDDKDYLLWTCTAWPIEQNQIVDTTGSGDAFVGAVIYAMVTRKDWSKDRLLRFASYVAMCKLKGLGARSTLPFLSQIDMRMFD